MTGDYYYPYPWWQAPSTPYTPWVPFVYPTFTSNELTSAEAKALKDSLDEALKRIEELEGRLAKMKDVL